MRHISFAFSRKKLICFEEEGFALYSVPCVSDSRHVCVTVSRRGNNKCDEVSEGWQSIRWKSSRKWARLRTPHQTQGYDRFSKQPLFALLALLSHTHPSHCRLHGLVATFWFSVFAFVFSSVSYLFLPRSHHSFLPFWETMRPHIHSTVTGNDKLTHFC